MRTYDPGDEPYRPPAYVPPPPVYEPPTYYEPPPVYNPPPVYTPPPVQSYEPPAYQAPYDPNMFGGDVAPRNRDPDTGVGIPLPLPDLPTYSPPPSYTPPTVPNNSPPDPNAFGGDVPPANRNPDGTGIPIPLPDLPPYAAPPSSNPPPGSTPPPVDNTSPTTPYVPPTQRPYVPGTPGRWDQYDWMKDLPTDWEVVGAEGIGKTGVDNAENNFQRILRQSFIDTGGDFSQIPDQFRKYIDQATIDAARNNKFSLMAQNALTMRRTLKGQRARMAARGSEISGANTEMTRRQLLDKELADINAYRGFEGTAYSGLGTVLDAELARVKGIQAANSSAAARLAAAHPAQWIEGTPDSGGDYVYGDGYNGGVPPPLTDISGNPYVPSGTLNDPTVALNAARLRRLQELGY